MHVVLGDYHVRDVEFVAAFDVDAKKVGLDLAKAIVASENNTIKFADVPPTRRDRAARRAPTTASASTTARPSRSPTPSRSTSSQVLRDAKADVLVSYLPVGSENADKFYAQCAIDAGVAFVNAIPVFIASDPEWAAKFEDAGVPIIGDDIKCQVGATITHRVLAKLFEDRGVVLDRTYQLNVGGNMDFKNMLERDRLESKKISKTQSVTSNIDHDLGARNVHIGPSDYVQWLDDRKWAYVRLEGRAFGDVPLNIEYKLEVWDSPNSAGIIIDAIRAAKIAKDRGIGGPLLAASSYLMKSPPVQHPDDEGAARSRRSSAATSSGSSSRTPPAAGSVRSGGPAPPSAVRLSGQRPGRDQSTRALGRGLLRDLPAETAGPAVPDELVPTSGALAVALIDQLGGIKRRDERDAVSERRLGRVRHGVFLSVGRRRAADYADGHSRPPFASGRPLVAERTVTAEVRSGRLRGIGRTDHTLELGDGVPVVLVCVQQWLRDVSPAELRHPVGERLDGLVDHESPVGADHAPHDLELAGHHRDPERHRLEHHQALAFVVAGEDEAVSRGNCRHRVVMVPGQHDHGLQFEAAYQPLQVWPQRSFAEDDQAGHGIVRVHLGESANQALVVLLRGQPADGHEVDHARGARHVEIPKLVTSDLLLDRLPPVDVGEPGELTPTPCPKSTDPSDGSTTAEAPRALGPYAFSWMPAKSTTLLAYVNVSALANRPRSRTVIRFKSSDAETTLSNRW